MIYAHFFVQIQLMHTFLLQKQFMHTFLSQIQLMHTFLLQKVLRIESCHAESYDFLGLCKMRLVEDDSLGLTQVLDKQNCNCFCIDPCGKKNGM